MALDLWLGPSKEIVLAGEPADAEMQQMMRLARTRFLPRAVLVIRPTGGPAARQLETLVPFVAAQQPLEGRATAYVCEQRVCQLPTTEPAKFVTLLDSP